MAENAQYNEDTTVKRYSNLKPFTGANDPRRSNGRKPGHKAKIRAFLNEFAEHPKKSGVQITEEDRIVIKAIELAVNGDRHARNFLFDRLYGKAVQPIQQSGTVRHTTLTAEQEREQAMREVAEIVSGNMPLPELVENVLSADFEDATGGDGEQINQNEAGEVSENPA